MGKPYRLRNLISMFVVLVMVSSSFLTVLCIAVLRGLHLLPAVLFAQVWMPVIILLVVNSISAVVHFLLMPRVIRPVEAIIEATSKVAKGDFTVRVSAENASGEVKELVNSFNAMTEELGSTEIFRSDFIRDFSHEFRTPIVSMKGFAKQLKNPNLTEEERQQYCDIIISESDRLANMSSSILLLSRFENQQIISDKARYRLDEQLRDSLLLHEKEWEKKNLELEVELDPIEITSNADVLFHVWNNLISNAIKFTPDGGKITLSAKANEECAIVTVRDTGIGMTEEQMKHAFDKCYQADPSHTGKGNGLGLCIAKRICTLAGGSISVRSKISEGSVFTVVLPK